MKKGKSEKVLVMLLLGLTVLTGCSGGERRNSDDGAQPVVATRVVSDDLGRQVTIPVKVTRVVSTAPSVTENIFAAGGGDRLVGVTTYCDYPEEAKAIAKIGDTLTPNMETIIALKPEIVFVSSASQLESFTKTLEQNGIAVYVTNPTSLGDVLKNLKQLGELFGTQEKVSLVVAQLQQRVDATVPPAEFQVMPHPRIFVQISKEPLFTVGEQSFVTDLIARAGGHSVTADVQSAYPKLSKETASGLNPEIIILSESPDNLEPNDVFKNSPAVKSGRIYKINADIISRPGPRLVDALEQISKSIGFFKDHPTWPKEH